MKKILFSAAVLVAAASTAQAADLLRKAPVYKAPVLQVYDWTGFYIGVNAGGSVGRDRTRNSGTLNGSPSTLNEIFYLSPAGAIGGGQAGYNWQFRNFYNLVLGVEADIQASGQRDSYACLLNCIPAVQTQSFNQKIDWFGTARVRAGIATGPVLSYVTGGYAYGHVQTSSNGFFANAPFAISSSSTRSGYTIGSGVEAQLGGNWTGKVEYLYVNLGTQSLAGIANSFVGPINVSVSSRIQDHIFRAGLNYGFGNNAGYVAPVANWSGFYIGGNVGSITGRNRSSTTAALPFGNEQFTLSPDGFIGGGQIGYNWQSSAWVFGITGDFQGSSAKDDKTCVFVCSTGPVGSSAAVRQTLPYLATARARIGYSVGSTLFYATGGFAYGQTKTRIAEAAGATTATVSLRADKSGYTVGGGIESPLTFLGLFGPNWTVSTEYLYVDLGRSTFSFAPAGLPPQTFTTQTREHIFRTGINYHFNTPVVAKY